MKVTDPLPNVVGHCRACGFYFYRDSPETHLGGCPRETNPSEIRRHQLEQFGLGLQRLLERVAGI